MNGVQKLQLKRLFKMNSFIVTQVQVRPFSSEFKRYFGFEEKLEQRKFRNDDNMEFSIKKMSKVAMFFTSCCITFPGVIL